jgi:hypothetical protein
LAQISTKGLPEMIQNGEDIADGVTYVVDTFFSVSLAVLERF